MTANAEPVDWDIVFALMQCYGMLNEKGFRAPRKKSYPLRRTVDEKGEGMAKKLEYVEVMWVEQAPDLYDGPNSDQHRPDWRVNEAGVGDVDRGGKDLCDLEADCFPAGTKIVISVPLCPECGVSADLGHFAKDNKCDCGFDWKEWAENEYS